ncbi:hypothetical protein EZV62_008838 [Acer yangbiense]|uniref:ATP synthase subunit gamma n=1 Tax=Acer yangbiense TaxID=1000413 RepID=A0A5C7IE23_9ROSI|nr:hypothetical protein EZV62_008838 [Acer yangbiense]
MSCSKSNTSSLSSHSNQNPFRYLQQFSSAKYPFRSSFHRVSTIHCGLRELKERIETVKNTLKITEAMKLVSAAKVRRAQEAVINSRPFTEKLVEFLFVLNEQLQYDDIDTPLTNIRPVKRVGVVVITSDRGLCGGFNNAVIRKCETRIAELKSNGIDCVVISVGKKGNAYFRRKSNVLVDSEEVDKVELVYTKFVSLVKSEPVVHTLLPLSLKGEACDVNGKCVDAVEDEMFRLTTKEGKLIVERDSVKIGKGELSPLMQFEQDPVQILDAMMPLYLNSQILRALQESVASEVASRMNAMSNATENATELKKDLTVAYNRGRQAKITNEILEIVAGAEALRDLD